jgi:hypothetical protein
MVNDKPIRWKLALALTLFALTVLIMFTVKGCAPRQYQEYRFTFSNVEQEWGDIALGTTSTQHENGFTITRSSPYKLYFTVVTHSQPNKRFHLQSVTFVDAGTGLSVLDVAPHITNKFHPQRTPSTLLSGADMENLDLPYTDYIVRVTFDIESDLGTDTHDVEFQLNRDYNEFWSFPMWQAMMGI